MSQLLSLYEMLTTPSTHLLTPKTEHTLPRRYYIFRVSFILVNCSHWFFSNSILPATCLNTLWTDLHSDSLTPAMSQCLHFKQLFVSQSQPANLLTNIYMFIRMVFSVCLHTRVVQLLLTFSEQSTLLTLAKTDSWHRCTLVINSKPVKSR